MEIPEESEQVAKRAISRPQAGWQGPEPRAQSMRRSVCVGGECLLCVGCLHKENVLMLFGYCCYLGSVRLR